MEEGAASRIAIDLGGSGARISVTDGRRRHTLNAPGWNQAAGAIGHLVTLVTLAMATESTQRKRVTVSAGLTGLNGVIPDIDEVGQLLATRFGVERLIVADDSLTSALGATEGKPAVVAAIGTGTVVLGLGAGGEVARVDGAGSYLGDRGSGWWIGRQGLIAAFSYLEGRIDGSRALALEAAFQYGDIYSLPDRLRASQTPTADIAAFAQNVANAAKAGDSDSLRIYYRAGRHIGTAIQAAAARTHQPEHVPVVLVGGVARSSDLIVDGIRDSLKAFDLSLELVSALGDALSGAEILMDRIPTRGQRLYQQWEDSR